MKKNAVKFLSMFALVAISITSISSCKDDDEDATPTPAATVGTAKVNIVHASPDAPGVDLLLNGTKLNPAPVLYLDKTGYLTVNEGTQNVKVNVAGTTNSVINANIPFTKNMNYSIFAVDSVSKISALLTTDDLTAPAAGKAHIRFIHLSPNAPAVDVAVTGGAVVFDDYDFKEVSDFTPLNAGTYDLEVRVAGTSTVALPLPGIALTAGKIYTVFAKGFLGGTGAQALGAEIIVNN